MEPCKRMRHEMVWKWQEITFRQFEYFWQMFCAPLTSKETHTFLFMYAGKITDQTLHWRRLVWNRNTQKGGKQVIL